MLNLTQFGRWLFLFFLLNAAVIITPAQTNAARWEAAANYSERQRGEAFLVYENGEIVYEAYTNGYAAESRHVLYSGTKSFSCAMATKAVEQGLLAWDERVSDTLTEWAADEQLRDVTLRQVLSLTSGLPNENSLSTRLVRDKLAVTLGLEPIYPPGERFMYGAPNFYIFGELLRRKLPTGDALEYLKAEILDPIGLIDWEMDSDRTGTPNFASGFKMTARDWLKYGQLILNRGMWEGEQVLDFDVFQTCFLGTPANPYYGLTWWLAYDVDQMPTHIEQYTRTSPIPADFTEPIVLGETQPTVWIAAGAFDQRLYIIPDRNLIVVRFSRDSARFSDQTMLQFILDAQ